MKSTRKIIPALVMLLVSAIMLSTASFAWLASSTSVSAGPMTVQANTDVVFMQISNSDAQDATWGRTATALTPASGDLELVNAYVNEGSIAWRTAKGYDPELHAPEEDENQDAIYTPVNTIDGTYALINTFYVKMSNAESTLTKLTISGVAVTGTPIDAETFDAALRVLVVAEKSGAVEGYQCWDLGTNTFSTANGFDAADILADIVDAEAITLKVYVYYDGEDEKAFTNNLSTASNSREITVSFSATQNP